MSFRRGRSRKIPNLPGQASSRFPSGLSTESRPIKSHLVVEPTETSSPTSLVKIFHIFESPPPRLRGGKCFRKTSPWHTPSKPDGIFGLFVAKLRSTAPVNAGTWRWKLGDKWWCLDLDLEILGYLDGLGGAANLTFKLAIFLLRVIH